MALPFKKVDDSAPPSEACDVKAIEEAASQALGGNKRYAKLLKTAEALNAVSDDLSRQVESVEAALKGLGFGIPVWYEFRRAINEDNDYFLIEDIGYGKWSNRWRILLRAREGDRTDPSDMEDHTWTFAEAPRELRIRAVDFIPQLLDKIAADAHKTAKSLSEKVLELKALAAEIAPNKTGAQR